MRRLLLLSLLAVPAVQVAEGTLMYCPVGKAKAVKPRITQQDVKCLATTIYGEARGESIEGQVAVAYTVVNRWWGSKRTICSVVLEPKQYSIYNDNPALQAAATNLKAVPPNMNYLDKLAWKTSFEIAKLVLDGKVPDPTQGATHYVSPVAMSALGYRYPKWTREFEQVAQIENHKFYRLTSNIQ